MGVHESVLGRRPRRNAEARDLGTATPALGWHGIADWLQNRMFLKVLDT